MNYINKMNDSFLYNEYHINITYFESNNCIYLNVSNKNKYYEGTFEMTNIHMTYCGEYIYQSIKESFLEENSTYNVYIVEDKRSLILVFISKNDASPPDSTLTITIYEKSLSDIENLKRRIERIKLEYKREIDIIKAINEERIQKLEINIEELTKIINTIKN